MGNRSDTGGRYVKGSHHYDKNSRRWYLQVYWGKPAKRYRIFRDPIVQKPFYDERDAIDYLGQMRAEITAGTFNPRAWFPDSPLLVPIYAKNWIDDIKDDVAPNTLKSYRGFVNNYISPYFKNKDIRHIRYHDIDKFRKHLKNKKNLGSKTIYNCVSALRTMMRYAWRKEDLPAVPPFPKLSYIKPEITYLTLEQQQEILAYIPDRDRPIFEFGMEYGLRPGEARALQKDCIIDDTVIIARTFSGDNTLRETTKTGRVRRYEITDRFKEILEAMPKNLSPFIFTRRDGKPYTQKNIQYIWQKATTAAGITIQLKNAFRHSLGCQLLDLGYPLDAVQQILGHTKIETTKRYATRRPGQIKDILNDRHQKIIRPNWKKNNSQ